MEACLRGLEEAYNLAVALLDEFDELVEADKALRSVLMQLELRLQQAGSYFLSDEQTTVVLNRIAEVGADTRRFCAYLGVEAIAKSRPTNSTTPWPSLNASARGPRHDAGCGQPHRFLCAGYFEQVHLRPQWQAVAG
jgi:hypothetical protein